MFRHDLSYTTYFYFDKLKNKFFEYLLIVFFEFKFGTGSKLKFFKSFKTTWQQINTSRKKAAQKIFVSNG
jgi:hypothetical protein